MRVYLLSIIPVLFFMPSPSLHISEKSRCGISADLQKHAHLYNEELLIINPSNKYTQIFINVFEKIWLPKWL